MSNVVTANPPVQITNQEFLTHVFGSARWKYAHIASFVGDPGNDAEARWGGGYAGHRVSRLERAEANNYFTVSQFNAPGRTRATFRAMYVVMLDDVGPKVDPTLVLAKMGPPTYRVETSPGNEQWHYVLDVPERDRGRAEALVSGMIARGLTADSKDPGMRGVCRYARLPVGTNGKAHLGPDGWRQVVRQATPGRTFTLDELAAPWGIELPEPGTAVVSGTRPALTEDELAQDVVLSAMEELGWVQGKTGNGWGYAVTCPWVEEHTGAGDNGCAYTAGPHGHWSCHHGHCQGRSYGSFYAGVDAGLKRAGLPSMAAREFDAVDPETLDETTAEHEGGALVDAPARFLDDHVFLRSEDAFYSIRARELFSRRAVNSEWAAPLRDQLAYVDDKDKDRVQPVDRWFFEPDTGGHLADGLAYWPGEARFFVVRGQELVNQYNAPARRQAPGPVSKTEIAVWLDLVRHVLGSEGPRAIVHFLDWCAGVVAVADRKPGWMVCVQGAQGIGKDLMMAPVKAGVGEDNAATIKGAQLASSFNEHEARRLVLISELRQTTTGSVSGHDQYNAIKSLVDTSAGVRAINPKYGRKYVARDVCAVFTSTNEPGAIALEADDRRVMVCMSKADRLSKAYYERVVAWLATGGTDRVVQWLLERWDSMGARRQGALTGNAPWTRSKRHMFLAGDDVLIWLDDKIAAGADPDWPDIMSAEDVQANIERAISSASGGLSSKLRAPSVARVGRKLLDLGCRPLAGGHQVRLRDGRKVRLWSLRNHDNLASASGGQLADLVERGENNFGNSNVIPVIFRP